MIKHIMCFELLCSALWGRKGNLDGLAMGNRQRQAGLGGPGGQGNTLNGETEAQQGGSG